MVANDIGRLEWEDNNGEEAAIKPATAIALLGGNPVDEDLGGDCTESIVVLLLVLVVLLLGNSIKRVIGTCAEATYDIELYTSSG